MFLCFLVTGLMSLEMGFSLEGIATFGTFERSFVGVDLSVPGEPFLGRKRFTALRAGQWSLLHVRFFMYGKRGPSGKRKFTVRTPKFITSPVGCLVYNKIRFSPETSATYGTYKRHSPGVDDLVLGKV